MPVKRRAVVAKPERPLGVAVVSGFLWLAALAAAVFAIAMVVAVSIDYAESARERDRFGIGPEVVAGVSAGAVGIFAAAVLLAWVGGANAAGRPWAWTAIAAGSIVLLVPSVIFAVPFLAYEPFVGLILVVVAVLLGLLPWYYRRADVRAFFGKARAEKPVYAPGRY